MSMGYAQGALIGPPGPGFIVDRSRLDPELAQYLATGNFPTYKLVAGTNFPISCLGYNDTTVQDVFFKFFPSTYSSGNLTLTIEWYSATGQTSGAVVWGASLCCIAPGAAQSVETATFATQDKATTTVNGTAKGLTQTIVTITDLNSIAAGDLVWLRLERVANDAGDTMTGDANMIFSTVSWSTQ